VLGAEGVVAWGVVEAGALGTVLTGEFWALLLWCPPPEVKTSITTMTRRAMMPRAARAHSALRWDSSTPRSGPNGSLTGPATARG
jgi:hypothetical protein